jgi:uncharacterized small protein (DUF1192 family)
MDDEEDIVRSKDWTQRNIEALSIEQLQEYISELKAEIERVEADIVAKKSHASAADLFFKS